MDIHALMHRLSTRRSLFHSEADFQHELGWTIHEMHPDAKVRLEYPIEVGKQRVHLDIWLRLGTTVHAFELKYGTSKMNVSVDEESYQLRDQAANDLTRYGFCADACRLEKVKGLYGETFIGHAILLTNYPPFWKPRSYPIETDDEAFRLHEGRTIHGTLRWGEKSKTPLEPLTLQNTYSLEWRDFSVIPQQQDKGAFRYLTVTI